MKALKTIGIIILILIIILVVVYFFLPKQVHIERTIAIKATPEVIFDQVNTLKNWEKWNPWQKIDTAMQITYSGPACGTDAMYEWSSKNPKVGSGKMLITYSKPPDTIKCNMWFMNKRLSHSMFVFTKTDSAVTVIWSMDTKTGRNPIHRFFGLFMEKMVGPDFEKGLKNLKEVAEKIPPAPCYKVEEIKITKQIYIAIKEACTMADIKTMLGKNFGELMEFTQKNGIKTTGAPFAMYFGEPNAQKFEIQAGVPVDKTVPVTGNIKYGEFKEGNAIMVDYTGPYDKVGPVYQALDSYAKAKNKKINGAPWEEYITDPMKEKDSTKWETKIYFPVE